MLYSFVSAALASIYVGTITLLAHVLQGRREPASAYSSALAAIFMTLLFNPLRIRAQRWVDRYFPRERLDPGLLQEAAGGFAHEMKRPLSKISLPAELALMDLERVKSGEIAWEDALPGFERRLRFIVSQSVDAGYMIEAIRELSASSASPFVPVDLREVINSVLSVEKDLLEKQAIVVNLRLPSDLSLVPGHARQLEIVFINLIKNAVEAMGDLPSDQRRELRIEGQSEQGQVIVRIIDTGPGIRPEEMEKIFQSQYSTKGLNGSGIGLYLSRQIVQAHGGTIDVRSEPGQGTEFILRFPQC